VPVLPRAEALRAFSGTYAVVISLRVPTGGQLSRRRYRGGRNAPRNNRTARLALCCASLRRAAADNALRCAALRTLLQDADTAGCCTTMLGSGGTYLQRALLVTHTSTTTAAPPLPVRGRRTTWAMPLFWRLQLVTGRALAHRVPHDR